MNNIKAKSMFDDILSRIKEQQENKNQEISELLDDIPIFQHKLIHNLKNFIDLAKENEIIGLEFGEKEEFDNGVIEYHFQLGEVNYILVTNKFVERLKAKNKKFGNYSFIYFDGDDQLTPFIKISVFTKINNQKYFSVSWFNSGEEEIISSDLNLNDDSGLQAARAIIFFLYSGDNYLKDAPRLEVFHRSSLKKGDFGFVNWTA
jgi:hypothetical protein